MLVDALMTVLQTILRLFPFPAKTGLRVIGNPGPESPVFVTCNFDLTVRRVVRALQGLDCYLLVAPSKGINVWCAAGGGMFNAHSVTSVVKTSRIGEQVTHRTLVLPQFSAPGIDVARVEQESGWHCRFGPAYATDIAAYTAAGFRKTNAMRQARFPLDARIEMAVMWAGLITILVLIPVLIFGPEVVWGLLALIWGFSLFLFVFFGPVMRLVPGGVGIIKTVLLGLVGVAGIVIYDIVFGEWAVGTTLGWSLAVLAVAMLLGFDLDGSSPLAAGSTIAFWGRKWPWVLDAFAKVGYELEPWFELRVDPERCRGCATCIEVCPVNVFELSIIDGRQRAQVARPDNCVQCTACVKQCPDGAILSDPSIKTFATSDPILIG